MTSFEPPDARPPVPAEDSPLPVTAVPTPPPAYPEYAGYAPPQGYAAPVAGYAGYAPGYPGYAGYQPAYQRRTSGLAIAAMTTSIVGLPLLSCYGIGVFVSLAGAIMGHFARRQITERGEDGGGMALAGIIVGWIGVGLSALIIAGLVVFFVAMAGS